jgi:hypothetical protein
MKAISVGGSGTERYEVNSRFSLWPFLWEFGRFEEIYFI